METLPLSFCLDFSVVKAARLFASADESRYVLCGVHVEILNDSTAIITATDGRRAIRFKTELEDVKGLNEKASFVIPNALVDRYRFNTKKKGPLAKRVRITVTPHKIGGSGKIEISDLLETQGFIGREIDGKFPNVANVIPSTLKPAVGPCFQYRFFADLAKAGEILVGSSRFSGPRGSRIFQCTKDGGVLVILPRWQGFEAVVVIMQLRDEEYPNGVELVVPEWATAGKEGAKKS